mmetsp:Transcript_21586/g.49742  ORF Transcript_21586/g.49742 Transcript_21586/m.49742 type:complete len:214 (+) Transcript_21586:1651-2292(+)
MGWVGSKLGAMVDAIVGSTVASTVGRIVGVGVVGMVGTEIPTIGVGASVGTNDTESSSSCLRFTPPPLPPSSLTTSACHSVGMTPFLSLSRPPSAAPGGVATRVPSSLWTPSASLAGAAPWPRDLSRILRLACSAWVSGAPRSMLPDSYCGCGCGCDCLASPLHRAPPHPLWPKGVENCDVTSESVCVAVSGVHGVCLLPTVGPGIGLRAPQQ